MHDVWTTDHGLPQNSVNAIVQTGDGYLWLGTQEGLVRFDGIRFSVFDKQNTPEIKGNWISCLFEDREGNLWIGTRGEGLNRFKDGKFSTYTTNEGLSNNTVYALYEDRDENLWIGTSGGLNRLKEGDFTVYTTAEGLSNNSVLSLFEGKDGSLWIGTSGGLNRFKNEKFTAYTTAEGLSNNRVRALYEDHDGSLWIGTTGGGLNRLTDGTFTTYGANEGLSKDIVNCLYEDRDGNLWIGTDGGGLNRLKNGTITAFTTTESLSNNVVFSLYEDRERNLWVGTNGWGLNRLKDGKFTAYTTEEGLSANVVFPILQDHNADLWIGTWGGLNRLKDGSITAYTTKPVVSLYEDHEKGLWIGTGEGMSRFKDGKFTAYTTNEGLSNNIVFSFYEDHERNLWIGTGGGGLNRLSDGKFTSYTTKDGLTNNAVHYLYGDNDGSLWIGTRGGLNHFKDGKFTTYTTTEGLSDNIVYCIYRDRDENLWIGTEKGGLNRFKNGKFTAYTTKDGLFNDLVTQILEDSKGNLWMSCNKGIFRVSKKELDDYDQGKTKSIHSVAYGKLDGMKSQECNGSVQPAGWKTSDGKLWFPTARGAVVIDPENIRINKVPPPVVIEQVVVDQDMINTRDKLEPITIPPGMENLEIHYTGLSFRTPERVKFQYKLEGFDNNWIAADTRRVAYYTNIPHGEYTFRLKASNDDGIWNEKGTSFSFYLKPYFYQTYWFYGLCALAVVAVVLGGHRIRVRQLHNRQLELANLVQERTLELGQTNQRLQEAQERIAQLIGPAPEALDNIYAWSKSIAEDIAATIGASEIGIWVMEGRELRTVTGSKANAPSMEELKKVPQASNRLAAGRTLVPVTGLSGELYGGLVITGPDIVWGDTERRLIAGFAHQLGGTLETQRMRKRLAEAERQKVTTMREMHEQGISTLQVCFRCGRCYDHTADRCETDGEELQSPRLLPYRIQDRYRIIRWLGDGGMGAVYKAYDETLNRDVAIKIVKAELLTDPSIRTRIEREANMIARIQHPGVVSIHDVGEVQDGSAFIVMEFLKGLDMAHILSREGPATPEQVARVLSQVGDALSMAHEQGVIHRDLKPANLFLTPGPDKSGFQVKILDFGLAKPIGDETSLTVSGILVGTPGYMSPEQARQQPIDQRSDLFSLAAVTYELLTGTVAFGADSMSDIVAKVLLEDPPPLSSKLIGVSAPLESAILDAFDKRPENRPESVSAWVSKIVPLLVETRSSVTGWHLESLFETLGT